MCVVFIRYTTTDKQKHTEIIILIWGNPLEHLQKFLRGPKFVVQFNVRTGQGRGLRLLVTLCPQVGGIERIAAAQLTRPLPL